MAVVERNAYILPDTGTAAEVNSFTPDNAPMTIQYSWCCSAVWFPIWRNFIYIGNPKRITCWINVKQSNTLIHDKGGRYIDQWYTKNTSRWPGGRIPLDISPWRKSQDTVTFMVSILIFPYIKNQCRDTKCMWLSVPPHPEYIGSTPIIIFVKGGLYVGLARQYPWEKG